MAYDISRDSKVNFKEYPYCKIYKKQEGRGLGIIRPTYESIHLNKIDKSQLTVLAPYFDECNEEDTVPSMMEEYLNMHNQKIIIKP